MSDDVKEGDALGLAPAHIEELCKGSAISLDVLRRAGVYAIGDAKAAAKLLGRRAQDWEERVPAWIAPYRLPFHDDPVRFRGKPAKPFETPKEDGSVSLAKYVEPKGSPVHLYFGPSLLEGRALKDTSIPLWITEGEKKCLSAESAGLSCIAVSGVNQWHRKGETSLHPDFAHVALSGREVFLCFDRDALQNHLVLKEEKALGRALLAAGAKVYVVRLPEDAPKLDDFFVRHEREEVVGLMQHARERGAVAAVVQAVGAPAFATEMSDLGNAQRFARDHGGTIRYCEQTGQWFLWTGTHWAADISGAVYRRAFRTVEGIYGEADALANDDARRVMRKHAQASQNAGRINAMIALARSFKTIAITHDAFDASPWLLNVMNGTIDLRTGELGPHVPENLITRLAPVHFEADAKHERWDAFMDGISDGDAEVSEFLQRAVGYSLTGDVREDKLFFLYGPPGRGKSTFVGAIEAALGDFAKTADISTFLANPNAGGDKARPDIVRLAGARIVVCKEISAGAKIDEGLVKTVTGGDVVTVRALHKAPFEMRPSFKLWLVANDPPMVRGDDDGMWRRIVRVPFLREVSSPDKGLREALLTDPELRSAIFAWAVAGVRKWLEAGLAQPQAIAESTAAYRAEMDPAGEFLEQLCVVEGEAKVTRKALREAYESWCREEGHSPVGARRFAAAVHKRLAAHGNRKSEETYTVRDVDGKPARAWRFLRLKTDLERVSESAWGARHEVAGTHVLGKDPLFPFTPNCAPIHSKRFPTEPLSKSEYMTTSEYNRDNSTEGNENGGTQIGTQNGDVLGSEASGGGEVVW